MNRRTLATAFAAALACAGVALAQSDAAKLALEYSNALKKNMELLREYSWKSRVEAQLAEGKTAAQIAQVRFDSKGEYERTVLGVESDMEKKRGIRGKIQKNRQEDARDLIQEIAKLLAGYSLPSTGKTVDFFEKATFGKSMVEGETIQIQGKNMYKNDDTVTLWIDPTTQLPKKLKVRTWVPKDEDDSERIWVDSVTIYDTLANGASYPKKSEVSILAKEMRLVIEEFDHIKQGG